MSEGNGSHPAGWVDFSVAKSVPFETVIEAMELTEALDKEGSEYKGICPIHGGTRDSFGFNVDKGLFHCFGCKRSGNVLDFVNHKLFAGKDIKGAARWLVALVETPAAEKEMPAEVVQSDVSVMTERDRAICRGVARYLSAVFAPLGNVEIIERELCAFVSREVERVQENG